MKQLYNKNRVFRTFVQSVGAYILTNAALAVSAMTEENWWKVLLTTLLIPAVSTAVADLTQGTYEGEK